MSNRYTCIIAGLIFNLALNWHIVGVLILIQFTLSNLHFILKRHNKKGFVLPFRKSGSLFGAHRDGQNLDLVRGMSEAPNASKPNRNSESQAPLSRLVAD